MKVVVFAKVHGPVKSENQGLKGSTKGDFESPQIFLKNNTLFYIFCGSNTPDKNVKSIGDIICPFANHLTGMCITSCTNTVQ